jgi:hypothetical protein
MRDSKNLYYLSSALNQPELPRACLNFAGSIEDRCSGMELATLLRDRPADYRISVAYLKRLINYGGHSRGDNGRPGCQARHPSEAR